MALLGDRLDLNAQDLEHWQDGSAWATVGNEPVLGVDVATR